MFYYPTGILPSYGQKKKIMFLRFTYLMCMGLCVCMCVCGFAPCVCKHIKSQKGHQPPGAGITYGCK